MVQIFAKIDVIVLMVFILPPFWKGFTPKCNKVYFGEIERSF